VQKGIVKDRDIIGTYFQTDDKQFGFVRYVDTGSAKEQINSTPLFPTAQDVYDYLIATYGLDQGIETIPTQKELNIIPTSISKDIISTAEKNTYMQVTYITDSQGNRSLVSLSP
jgi:hypothetical protein